MKVRKKEEREIYIECWWKKLHPSLPPPSISSPHLLLSIPFHWYHSYTLCCVLCSCATDLCFCEKKKNTQACACQISCDTSSASTTQQPPPCYYTSGIFLLILLSFCLYSILYSIHYFSIFWGNLFWDLEFFFPLYSFLPPSLYYFFPSFFFTIISLCITLFYLASYSFLLLHTPPLL